LGEILRNLKKNIEIQIAELKKQIAEFEAEIESIKNP
jgi:hypothetical protein